MKIQTLLTLSVTACLSAAASAQDKSVERINSYGTFDRWCVREIKESGIIGGKTAHLYEFYGAPSDTLRTGKKPYEAPEDYLWRTNNVLAIVAGVVKTNNTVYPEKRGEGYCARIETHIEEVKALGIVNMDVTCQGALMIGALPEPIKDTKSPMAKVLYGIGFNGRPKALRLDYKADVGHEVIRGTGFSKLKPMGYPDYGMIVMILQKRWEDENGHVFIHYTVGALAEATGKCEMTIKDCLNKLELHGLIYRQRQGAGKPNKIYVRVQTETCPSGGTSFVPQTDRKLSTSNKQRNNKPKTIRNYDYEEGESL